MDNITIYFNGQNRTIDIPEGYEVISSCNDTNIMIAAIKGDLSFSSLQGKFDEAPFYDMPSFWLCLIRKKKKEKKKVG